MIRKLSDIALLFAELRLRAASSDFARLASRAGAIVLRCSLILIMTIVSSMVLSISMRSVVAFFSIVPSVDRSLLRSDELFRGEMFPGESWEGDSHLHDDLTPSEVNLPHFRPAGTIEDRDAGRMLASPPK